MPVMPSMKSRRRSGGFTLIEVLIAVVLLTTGLLGLASLQATGTRLNHSSYMRSQATVLAYDIVDRMRANVASARTGGYNIALGANAPTGTTMEAIDLAQWKATLGAVLPEGDGSIAADAGGVADSAQRVTVVVRWNDGRTAADVVSFTVTSDI